MLDLVCSICSREFTCRNRRKVCSPECNRVRRQRASTTHGEHGTRLYRIWNNLKNRCHGKAGEIQNALYHERGISVCAQWEVSFAAFRDWAMENGYSDSLALDRRESDKGYSPDNCRWADRIGQARNRRKRTDSAMRSKYKGVSPIQRSSKWLARATACGVTHYLGAFETQEDAARAYDAFAVNHFGEFARTNFARQVTRELEPAA